MYAGIVSQSSRSKDSQKVAGKELGPGYLRNFRVTHILEMNRKATTIVKSTDRIISVANTVETFVIGCGFGGGHEAITSIGMFWNIYDCIQHV